MHTQNYYCNGTGIALFCSLYHFEFAEAKLIASQISRLERFNLYAQNKCKQSEERTLTSLLLRTAVIDFHYVITKHSEVN